MSFVALSDHDSKVTSKDLHEAAKTAGFNIPAGSQDEADFLKFLNGFEATASKVAALPDYIDPRLEPVSIQGGDRKWTRPSPADNPLNAWSHKCRLLATNPSNNKLAGKTVAIKANVSVAGAPLNVGTSEELFEGKQHAIATIDATVVKRILEAGGTILGTGVCENFSLSAISTTAHTGPVQNSWAPGYATGGSSSGVTSLISAKDVNEWQDAGRTLPFELPHEFREKDTIDMAVGGDQGGSIRLPAHYAGIYGLKPTYGLCPYTGIASLHPMVDHTGPMARSIADVALLLEVMAGADGIDFRQSPETPLRDAVPQYSRLLSDWQASKRAAGEWTPSTAGRGLRIGILQESFSVHGLSPSVEALIHAAIKRFTTLGASVTTVSVPLHALGPSLWTISTRTGIPSALGNHAPSMLSHPLPSLRPLAPDQAFYDYIAHRNPAVINALLNAAYMNKNHPPSLARKAHMHVTQLTAAYDAALREVDVLITPTSGKPAPKIPEGIAKDGSSTSLGAMDASRDMTGVTLNTCPFNLTGHPGLSLPVGWVDVEGGRLPVGMQIVGRRWGDLDVLKAGMVWEVGGKGLDAL